MNRRKIYTVLLALIIIAGCQKSFAEDKNIKPVKQFKASVSDYKADFINKDWWNKYNDPMLLSYIIKAAGESHDLKIASIRVKEAKALVDQYYGKEFPTISYNTNISRQKTSDTTSMGSLKLHKYSQSSFVFPLVASYELDLWMKNREATEYAAKELQAVKCDEKTAYIIQTSSIAAAYFNLIKFDGLIETQKRLITIKENILAMVKTKQEWGMAAQPEVNNAEKNLIDAKSTLEELQKQQNIFLNQLAVLTGSSVEDTASFKRSTMEDINLPSDIPDNFKSEIILERPDIIKAETKLHKARIEVKLARKEFLPDITISGQYGFNSNSFSKAINSDSYIASIATGIAGKIFTGGARRAKLRGKKLLYEEMLQNYQKTVLTSFQEVNDSLFALNSEKNRNLNSQKRLEIEKRNYYLNTEKYKEGIISLLSLYEAEEKLLNLKKDDIAVKSDLLISSLNIYKAVGGKI